MKGIVLAGGTGTRLYPVTKVVSKQLLPVYDKPMIYYPLSVLMLAQIKEILIITTPHDLSAFNALLGDGSQWGISLQYSVQEQPNGIAESFIIGREFIGNDKVALILGDNIFWGHGLAEMLQRAGDRVGGSIFAYHVNDPERYGVVELNGDGNAVNIEEKPEFPKSNWAVTGLYFYDANVVEIAAEIQPSNRGELEITDVNNAYLKNTQLHVETLGRGFAWLDTGTHESLLEASEFVHVIQNRQAVQIANLEEIGFRNGFVDRSKLQEIAVKYANMGYGQYLQKVLDENIN